MVEVSKKNKVKLQVAFMKRFDPGLQKAHNLLKEIGEILLMNVWMYDSVYHGEYLRPFLPSKIVYSDEEQIHKSSFDNHLAHMLELAVHQADLINWFGGKVKAVSSLVKEEDKKIATTHTLEFESEAIGCFQFLRVSQMDWAEGLIVHGTKGTIKIDIPFPYLRQASKVLFCKNRQYFEPIITGINQYQLQLESFANSIIEDKPTWPSGKDGLEAEKLIYAMYYSAKRGEKVKVSEVR